MWQLKVIDKVQENIAADMRPQFEVWLYPKSSFEHAILLYQASYTDIYNSLFESLKKLWIGRGTVLCHSLNEFDAFHLKRYDQLQDLYMGLIHLQEKFEKKYESGEKFDPSNPFFLPTRTDWYIGRHRNESIRELYQEFFGSDVPVDKDHSSAMLQLLICILEDQRALKK